MAGWRKAPGRLATVAEDVTAAVHETASSIPGEQDPASGSSRAGGGGGGSCTWYE